MSKAALSSEYRDNPDAVPLLPMPNDYTYDDVLDISDLPGLPPSYADSQANISTSQAPIRHIPPPTHTDHVSPLFFDENGYPQISTASTMDTRYDHDPVFLESAIRSLAQTALVPYIQITGSHKETTKASKKTETRRITDFRIALDLSPYIHPPSPPATTSSHMTLRTVLNTTKTHRGGIFATCAPSTTSDVETPPSLTEWTHHFTASPAPLRSFRLTRRVTGLDTTYLRNRITGLLRRANYRGHIAISFPVGAAHVDIHSSHAVNRWRHTPWVRWTCYLTFLWLITWPVLFVLTKRYAVVTAEWAFSARAADGTKRYTTISEEEIIQQWSETVVRLAAERYRGAAVQHEILTRAPTQTRSTARFAAREAQGETWGHDI